jgi:hypothetical protein
MLTPEERIAVKKRLEALALNINTPHDIVLNSDEIDVPIPEEWKIEEQNGIL